MTEEKYQVCGCIRTDCWHDKGKCDEPPVRKGGECLTCRTYPFPKRCEACGQIIPPEDDNGRNA